MLRNVGLCAALVVSIATGALDAQVVVEEGTTMRYAIHSAAPAYGSEWVDSDFDDSAWSVGSYGVGYDPSGSAADLLSTVTATGLNSIYTRATFTVDDPAEVSAVFVGFDYDDGCVAWINGVEVYRSPEMPVGALAWDSSPDGHESSNDTDPDYGVWVDIAGDAIPALVAGENTFAVGVWNSSSSSSDLVLVPLLVVDPPQDVVRGPYLQKPTESSMIVRWRTLYPAESHVDYGPAADDLSSTVSSTTLTTEHEVEISGLEADTTYFYSLGDGTTVFVGGDADHSFTTCPEAGVSRPFRAWVLGDSGTANAEAEAVRDAYYDYVPAATTDLWIMLGDNAYDDGTDREYQAAVFDMYPETLRSSPLWPAFGNHDAFTAESAGETGPYYDIFTLPTAGECGGEPSDTEAYYSFDYGDVHFIVLDSADSALTPPSTMLDWLEDDLLASESQRWTIALWHHPPYSKGSHDSDDESRLIDMRENAVEILEDHGVDLVMCGHSHAYERSFLIDGHYGLSGTFVESMKVDPGDGRETGDGAYAKPTAGRAPHEGAVYVVAGSSGRVSSSGDLDHPAMFTSVRRLGSAILDVDGNRLDVVFIDDEGVISDEFTLIKGADPFVRGDTNDDQALNLGDVIELLSVLYLGTATECADALDVDDNEALDLVDALALLDVLFGGVGDTIPAPNRCGSDPTPGALGCASFVGCE